MGRRDREKYKEEYVRNMYKALVWTSFTGLKCEI